jgi:hypothetical protein
VTPASNRLRDGHRRDEKTSPVSATRRPERRTARDELAAPEPRSTGAVEERYVAGKVKAVLEEVR